MFYFKKVKCGETYNIGIDNEINNLDMVQKYVLFFDKYLPIQKDRIFLKYLVTI